MAGIDPVEAHLSGRHPFEIFVLIFAFVVGLPALLGVSPRPGSIQEATPEVVGFLWSLVLVVGSAIALVGIFWQDRAVGLLAEQFGLALVGAACFLYAGVAFVTVDGALVPAGIIFGFAVACLAQYRRIQKLVDAAAAAGGG